MLSLGGGPGAATLEVAIYESVRFDVDFARAALLALLQVAICLVLALPILWLGRRPAESAATGGGGRRPDAAIGGSRCSTSAVIALGALLVLPPLLAVALSGIAARSSLFRSDVAQAAATSFAIAIPAALLALALALGLAASARRLRNARPPGRGGGHVAAERRRPRRAAGRRFGGAFRGASAVRRSVRARDPFDHSGQCA